MAVQIPQALSDHPQLVGIVRFPFCNVETEEVAIPLVIKVNDKYMSLRQVVDMATSITPNNVESGPISINKANITDFYPYTYYVLTDYESDPLIMLPQYLPSSFTIKGRFALSHNPIEKYFPSIYKGDMTGNVYNITNTSQMMLPTSSNEGISYINANANAISTQRGNRIFQNVISGVGIVGSAVTGNVGGVIGSGASLVNGIMALKENDARMRDIEMTPNTISSFGTPSTRKAFGTDVVSVLKYTVSDNVKSKINNYINRYGNKFNNYATIDLKGYRGYLKTIDTKLETGIDNIFASKIKSVLERGVYFE